jgi:hypothetical protein
MTAALSRTKSSCESRSLSDNDIESVSEFTNCCGKLGSALEERGIRRVGIL